MAAINFSMSTRPRKAIQLAILGASILTSAAMAADPLGRLFLSPEERRLIDIHPERGDNTGASNTGTRNESDLVTVNGIVIRSGGKSTIWLNRTPLREGQSIPVGRPTGTPKPPAVDVILPGQPGAQRIKPGQSYDPSSGSITENFTQAPPAQSAPEAKKPPTPTARPELNPADYAPKIPGMPPIPR